MQGIVEVLRQQAMDQPDRPLYHFLDCEADPFASSVLTIGEVYRRAQNIAADLHRKGAKKGDRAIIFSMQDPGTVIAIYGCMLAGVIFTVIPPPIDDGKLNRFISVLKSCAPKFLISNEQLEKSSETNVAPTIIRKAFFNAISLKRVYTDRVCDYNGPEIICQHNGDDLAYLQYTSGSTSAPKGVMVSYGNLAGCIEGVREIFDFTQGDHNIASWVPFYHNIGLVVAIFIPVWTRHGVSYFIPTMQFLKDPTIWLRVLSEYRIDITAAPNSAYDTCTKLITPQQAHRYDLAHVTHLINGSEFVSAHTIQNFCQLFGLKHDVFACGYGLSECVCVATLASRDYRAKKINPTAYEQGKIIEDPDSSKSIVSVGCPASNTTIVAVGKDGMPCAPGEIGEIYIQGSSVCRGYWKNPEETDRFRATIPGYEGFFYQTGDMGVMQDGHLFLTGRVKEMIVINGKNIFPTDIALLLHENRLPLSLDAVSIFSLQANSGERAVLCAESDARSDFQKLARAANQVVARSFDFSFYDIVFVSKDSMPRTDNRKIKTLATRKLYEEDKLNVLYSTRSHADPEMMPQDLSKINLPREPTQTDLEPLVRTVFAKLLPTASFGPDESFLELGGDSLLLVTLVSELENILEQNVDLNEIAAAPTIGGISAYLARLLNGKMSDKEIDLRQEGILAEDIALSNGYQQAAEECRNILLTGSTGFLGAYLIRSLIQQRGTKGLTIYCHCRADSPEKGLERVISNLKFYHCWQETYRAHLVAIPGDLSLPLLGLKPETYAKLSNTIDMIYHNGAQLNFIYPYEQLKRTNVIGTEECLRFACMGKAKYFHYISSYSVYDNFSHFGKRVLEDEPLDSPEGYFLGYSQTKWVAEKLVKQARERGLRAAVYRPGEITGTLADGIWQLDDLVSRSLVGCIQLGYTPDVEVNLHLTPVDYVSDAIVHISFQTAASGHAFNLINTHIMPMKQINELICNAGYTVRPLPYDQWCAKLTATSPDENALRILSGLFHTEQAGEDGLIARYGVMQAQFDTSNADALLQGSGIACPPVDRFLISSYLAYFQTCGHLPRPI